MSNFFTNLIGRHLGTCDTTQPRTLGRFEVDRGRVTVASPDEGTNPVVSESDQTLQPPGEAPYELPKETTSEINPLASTVAQRDHPIDLRSTLSAEAPKVTLHESGPIGNKKNYSFSSLPEQSDHSAQLGLTEQQAVLSDSQALPGKPYDTQTLDADRYSPLGAMAQEQQAQPNKTALVIDEHNVFSGGHVQTNINEPDEVMRDKTLPPASPAGEHYLESELNHQIRTMLQHLADDTVSPTTGPAPDGRGSQGNENLTSIPSEKKAPPLPDTAVALLDPAPTLEQKADLQDRISANDGGNSALYDRLEPPSWLPEIEARFSPYLQETDAKAEPVVNVTIGRVEVRAIQTEAPKNVQGPKKPTGVMTLDEYLQRREGRGQR